MNTSLLPIEPATIWPSRPTKAPPPGIYENVPLAEYLRLDAWSQTDMKAVGRWDNDTHSLVAAPFRTPAHLHARLTGSPAVPTKEMRWGTHYHALLLEPNRFKAEYHVLPESIKGRRKAGDILAWELAETNYGIDRVLSHEDWKELAMMAHAAAAHDLVRPLIGAVGRTELTIIWIDAETGLACKGRIDKLIKPQDGPPTIPDLKTCRCAHWAMFERQYADLGYDIQAATYHDGLLDRTGESAVVRAIAQETTPPYLPVVYKVRAEVIDSGRTKYRACLAVIAECLKTGLWPGYADDFEVDLDVPVWAHAENPDKEPANAPTRKERRSYMPDIAISREGGLAESLDAGDDDSRGMARSSATQATADRGFEVNEDFRPRMLGDEDPGNGEW